MSRLVWDATGERLYETGVEMGVLYPQASNGTYPKGVAWNGLSSIGEKPSGAEATAIWADNQKYLNLISAEEFGATIEAYMYPDEFAVCDGTQELAPGVFAGQQNRKAFGLAYKTILGNDVDSNNFAYKLHIVYGCLASPSEKTYSTVNDSPEAISFSWEVKTTPENSGIEGVKAMSTITIDSSKYTETAKLKNLKELEKALFGFDATTEEPDAIIPYLPKPAQVVDILAGTKTAKECMPNVG